MGYLSRQPNSNKPSIITKSNPWSPETDALDETAALLNSMAMRCCDCNRVIDKIHLTITRFHAFCPDCKLEASCKSNGKCQGNVLVFLDCNPQLDPRI
jgi:hypothetical protein